MITNNVDRLDDINVFERRADAKLCGDFLLVVLLRLTVALGPELLHGKDMTTVFVAGFDQAYSAPSTRAQHAAPLAILFRNVGLGSS